MTRRHGRTPPPSRHIKGRMPTRDPHALSPDEKLEDTTASQRPRRKAADGCGEDYPGDNVIQFTSARTHVVIVPSMHGLARRTATFLHPAKRVALSGA
eukprot:scaffold168024_cov35-Tisochrysis_lutea.AAC.1